MKDGLNFKKRIINFAMNNKVGNSRAHNPASNRPLNRPIYGGSGAFPALGTGYGLAGGAQGDGRRKPDDLRLRPEDRTGGPPTSRSGGPRRGSHTAPPRRTKETQALGQTPLGLRPPDLLGFCPFALGLDRRHRHARLDRHPPAADPVAGNSQAPALGADPRRQRRDACHPRRHGRRRGAAARIAGLCAQGVRRHRGPPFLFASRRRSARASLRALVADVLRRGASQGGSTITQQLAKNLFLTQERTVSRKLQEIVLALWLEHKFTKAEILELYLNRVYFGSGAYGVEAAAQRYFGKSARQLTLAEAAMLAGLVQSPSRLAPSHNPDGAERRAALVLADMAEQKLIGAGRQKPALAHPARAIKPAGGRLGQLCRRLGDGRGRRPRRQVRRRHRRRNDDRSGARAMTSRRFMPPERSSTLESARVSRAMKRRSSDIFSRSSEGFRPK